MKPVYIEICLRNLLNRQSLPSIPPISNADGAIMIFDIDYCLYQSSKMHEAEKAHIESTFNEIGKDHGGLRWADVKGTDPSSKVVIYKTLKMSVKEILKRFSFHDIEKFVTPNDDLANMLNEIKCRKFCFTNGCVTRAEKAINHLGLSSCFEAIFCTDSEEDDLMVKPGYASYNFIELFLELKGLNRPEIIFFDDLKENCEMAEQFGWKAVHVTSSKNIMYHLASYACRQNPMVSKVQENFPGEQSTILA